MADTVVRSTENTLVVAGPGAGKTEVLAQRACYLLQTNMCVSPRRILAISFKKDAAKTIRERVQKRCVTQSYRFDSFTLDAFGKSILDRFRTALTEAWSPNLGYEVRPRLPNIDSMKAWITRTGAPPGHRAVDIHTISNVEIERTFERFSHEISLPFDEASTDPLTLHQAKAWWSEQLAVPPGQPSLTFPMINRLAAHVLKTNPKIKRALSATYSHVFLDEFQDTTHSQYELLKEAFGGSSTIITAVGDNKQRIMVWAGAMQNVFEAYAIDFNALMCQLLRNYRSFPELVRMQHFIAQSIESTSHPAEATQVALGGTCQILEFKNPEEEGDYLASYIFNEIQNNGKSHRDFCIIVRQKTAAMIEALGSKLLEKGIRIRDESFLQDMLVEPVVAFVVTVLRLATRSRDPEAWESLCGMVSLLFGFDEPNASDDIHREAARIIKNVRVELNSGFNLETLPIRIVTAVGESAFRSTYRQYRSGQYLFVKIEEFSDFLISEKFTTNPSQAIDNVVGKETIPAMTIHKSKSLEFDTVIFIGLEDSQWWSFANNSEEEKRGFFVAFSRAIERVYFTFSDFRPGNFGMRPQMKEKIGALYTILRNASVPIVDCRIR